MTRHAGQRSAREPRAMKGLRLRAGRSARSRATACMGRAVITQGRPVEQMRATRLEHPRRRQVKAVLEGMLDVTRTCHVVVLRHALGAGRILEKRTIESRPATHRPG